MTNETAFRWARLSGVSRVEPNFIAWLLITLVLVTYGSSISNGFVLDDRAIVLGHPLVMNPLESWRAFAEPYWPVAVGGGQYRPIGIISFAVDHAIAGDASQWYHAVNVAWHAAVVCLLWVWLRDLLPPTAAVFAASVFAVHPVHVEAVANVVGRLELMAAAFLLGALLAHRRKSWLAPVLYGCALFSKEHAIVFIPTALLVHWLEKDSRETIVARSRLWMSYAAVTMGWLGLMSYAVAGHATVTSAVLRGLTIPERLLTVLTVVPEYARLMVFPFRLSGDYEPDVLAAARSFTPTAVLGLCIIVLCALVAARTWKGERAIPFAIGLFVVSIAPVSNVFFPTGVALAERTLYFPSIGVCILAGLVLQKVKPSAVGAGVVACLLVGAFLIRTWTRVPVWRDSRAYALTILAEQPKSYRGHWVAARVLWSIGDLPGAQREFALARQIYGDDENLNDEAQRLADALQTSLSASGGTELNKGIEVQ